MQSGSENRTLYLEDVSSNCRPFHYVYETYQLRSYVKQLNTKK